MSRYRREDHAGRSSDCSVHRPHLGDNKASKTFRFYNRWVIALLRTLCLCQILYLRLGPWWEISTRAMTWHSWDWGTADLCYPSFWSLPQMFCFKVKEERDSDRTRLVLWNFKVLVLAIYLQTGIISWSWCSWPQTICSTPPSRPGRGEQWTVRWTDNIWCLTIGWS